MECIVEHIDLSGAKVSRIEKLLATDESTGQAPVDRTICFSNHSHSMGGGGSCSIRQRYSRVPTSDRAIERGEDEESWCTRRQQEISLAVVGNQPCWGANRRLLILNRWRNDDRQRLLGSWAVVQGSNPSLIVGHPPGAA